MILLTGTSGFIGKKLLNVLLREYGKENILALTSSPIKECRYLLHNNFNFDEDFFLESGFDNIDTIIHAGAFTPKNGRESNNVDKSNSNITNTTRLINAKLPNLKKFIFLSTLDVYAPTSIISENSIIDPISLYGQSKLYCEKIIRNWAKTNNYIYQLLRIGHTYGPGEELYEKIIPITFKNIIESKPVQLFGNGNEVRSFIYISDVTSAISKAIHLKSSNVINIVGNEQISISNLITKIITITGKDVEIIKVKNKTIGRDLIFDNQKMKAILFLPKTLLDEGLKNEWDYMKHL